MSVPVRPYAPALRAGEWVVTSGQVGTVPGSDGTPQLVPGGTVAELRQALSNMSEALGSEGATLADVVKATVYLADMSDYPAMNEVWVEIFAGRRPTRSAVGVAGLPLGARVEIEAWAHVPGA